MILALAEAKRRMPVVVAQISLATKHKSPYKLCAMTLRKPLLLLSIGLSFILAFAAGVRFGATTGIEQFMKMDSSAKASLLTGELRLLRAGKGEALIQTKEIELDGSIVNAIEFQNSGMPWLFWPHSNAFEHARYLDSVARYRKEFPSVIPTVAPAPEKPGPVQLREYSAQVKSATQALLERYGK
jgi:hypothetical protein